MLEQTYATLTPPVIAPPSQLLSTFSSSPRFGGGGGHEGRQDSDRHIKAAQTLASRTEKNHCGDSPYVLSADCRCGRDGCKVIAAACMARFNAVQCATSSSVQTEYSVRTSRGMVSNHQIC